MRVAIAAIFAVGSVLTMATPAFAQGLRGDVDSGRRFAGMWCGGCHQTGVDGARFGMIGPVFRDVANLPSTTALSLRVFMQSSHPTMPNVQLTREETDDIVAYILSLKSK